MFVMLCPHKLYEKIVPCVRVEHHHGVVVQKAVPHGVLGTIAFCTRLLCACIANRVGFDQAANICEVFGLADIPEKHCEMRSRACSQSVRLCTKRGAAL